MASSILMPNGVGRGKAVRGGAREEARYIEAGGVTAHHCSSAAAAAAAVMVVVVGRDGEAVFVWMVCSSLDTFHVLLLLLGLLRSGGSRCQTRVRSGQVVSTLCRDAGG